MLSGLVATTLIFRLMRSSPRLLSFLATRTVLCATRRPSVEVLLPSTCHRPWADLGCSRPVGRTCTVAPSQVSRRPEGQSWWRFLRHDRADSFKRVHSVTDITPNPRQKRCNIYDDTIPDIYRFAAGSFLTTSTV